MNIADIADKIVLIAEKGGATQAEVYAICVKTASTYIDDDIPKIGAYLVESGVGLKYIIGKQIGFTSSTLSHESPEDVVERAKSIARVSNEDLKFVSLPEPKKVSSSPDKYHDNDTAAADSTILMEKAMEVVKAASAENVTVPNGSLRTSSVQYHIRNSLGVDIGSKGTVTFGFFTAKSENGSIVGEGVQRCWSRELSSIDFSKIGEALKSQALSVLTAKPFKEKWDDAVGVLAPSEGSEILYSLVAFAANGDNVNKRSSPWADKVGETVASESISIVDNGLSEKGLLGSIVDDEGVPTQKTQLIENGVLKSYFFDSYNANQLEMQSTGNGIRRNARDLAGRFAVPAVCAGTTMEVEPSSKSIDDIISEIKRGVYVEHFAWPIVDAMSGTFSNEIRNARIIENGELGEPIKYALWVGNLYESLKSNVMVANDPEVHDKRVIPTIAFPGTEVVGQ
ncbi:MAG: TldD/PmbA family protein [Candidatus Thorarchaeota archaeon]|nr:MAG: TldD/PmbA family protein [Candidatus Thorarchaeota archaeon]